jgi:hypothetical protein
VSPVNKIPQFILPDDLEPVYANVARISHTQAEVILDFLRMLPGQSSPVIKSRLIMSPLGAKLLLRVLGENLSRYEANFGEIRLPGETSGLVNELFRSIHPPEKPPQSPDDKLDEQ